MLGGKAVGTSGHGLHIGEIRLLIKIIYGIQPVAVHASVCPEIEYVKDLSHYLGVFPV